MNVFINAISIKEGGSKVLLTRLLPAMCEARPDIAWVVAVHPKFVSEQRDRPQVTWLTVPWFGSSAIGVMRWYELVLPSLLRRYGIDVLFSQTNYLPRRRLDCPSLLLVQNAGHFSPVFNNLTRAYLRSPLARWLWERKRRWVRRSVHASALLTVQTEALAAAVSASTGLARDRMAVIPHGPGLVCHLDGVRPPRQPNVFRIGYVSTWGVQKDFATLFRASQILRDAGRRFKLVLTLDESKPETSDVFNMARRLAVFDLIDNRGEVGQHNIMPLYDSFDMFVFPSLCESFGFPTVEAMARGLPIVVAATAENVEVSHGAALTFPPGDASALASQIERLMDDDRERIHRSELSLATSRRYSWQRAAVETISALESTSDLSK